MPRLKINRPLRSGRISQGWGENNACVGPDNRIKGVVNGACPRNTVPFYKSIGMKGHNGIDFPCIIGEAIVHGAMFDGWMRSETDMAGGIGVDVISKEPLFFPEREIPTSVRGLLQFTEHEGERGYMCHVKLRYWHLLSPIGWDKKEVKFGQIIGLGGNTGASSGAHLHFGVKLCDEKGDPLDRWNGYFGAMDPTPYLNNNVYAGDAIEYLGIGTPTLTREEKQTINTQLSVLKRALLALRELLAKL